MASNSGQPDPWGDGDHIVRPERRRRPGGPRAQWAATARPPAPRRPTAARSRPAHRPASGLAKPLWRTRQADSCRPAAARVILVALRRVVLWLASGFYRVEPDEQGVVLRFGAFTRTTLAGSELPPPLADRDRVTPAVTRINRIEIGYRSGRRNASDRQMPPAAATSRPKA